MPEPQVVVVEVRRGSGCLTWIAAFMAVLIAATWWRGLSELDREGYELGALALVVAVAAWAVFRQRRARTAALVTQTPRSSRFPPDPGRQ